MPVRSSRKALPEVPGEVVRTVHLVKGLPVIGCFVFCVTSLLYECYMGVSKNRGTTPKMDGL